MHNVCVSFKDLSILTFTTVNSFFYFSIEMDTIFPSKIYILGRWQYFNFKCIKTVFSHIFPYILLWRRLIFLPENITLVNKTGTLPCFLQVFLFSFSGQWALILNIPNCGETVLSSANPSSSQQCPIYAFPCRQVITFIWNVLFYPAPPKFLCHFHCCATITYFIVS